MAITAEMVKQLRDKTGAGMMDCKAALTETNGDMEKAIDWLRKKGLSKAAKKAGRVAAEGLGKIGVLVALESAGDVDQLSLLGRQIAMHVAATNPAALDASGIDAAVVERESVILREKNAGKPDHVLQKIVESGLKTYHKEVTLLEQAFVHEPSKSVAQVLKEAAAKAGAPVRLAAFVRFALGEGIEKDDGGDFAAEVAAQAGLKKPNGEDKT